MTAKRTYSPQLGEFYQTAYTTGSPSSGVCGHAHKTIAAAESCRDKHREAMTAKGGQVFRQVFRVAIPSTKTGRKWFKAAGWEDISHNGVRVKPTSRPEPPPQAKPTCVVIYSPPGELWRLVARRAATGHAYIAREVKHRSRWQPALPPTAVQFEDALLAASDRLIRLI